MFECLLLENYSFLRNNGQPMFRTFSMCWALLIIFCDCFKMVIISEKVLEVIFCIIWCCVGSLCLFRSCVTSFSVIKKRQSKHHHNELCFYFPQIEIFLNMFQALPNDLVFNMFRYCLKGLKKKSGRFPRGQKRKSKNDHKHGHGQEKRRPSTLCWGIFLLAMCIHL